MRISKRAPFPSSPHSRRVPPQASTISRASQRLYPPDAGARAPLEEHSLFSGRDAGAVVLDRDDEIAALFRCGHGDPGKPGRMVHGIPDEGGKDRCEERPA